MKGRIKENKKIIITIFYTLLILSILNFNIVPSSHSKYIKKGELAYNSEFYKLNNGKIELTQSNPSTNAIITYQVSFERNNVVRDGEKDTYTIEAKGCDVSIKDKDSNKISFTNPGKEKVSATITCHLTDVTENDKIKINVTVKEKVADDISEFTYAEASDTLDLEEYLKDKFEPTNILLVDEKSLSIYDTLKELIEKSYEPKYIDDVYTSATANSIIIPGINKYISIFKDATKDNINDAKYELPGLEISTTENPGFITFKILDTFNGYAATLTQNIYNYMYFTYNTPNKATVQGILNKYLDKIYSPEEITKINNYFADKDIIDYIISGTNVINGLSRGVDAKAESVGYNLVRINISNLLKAISGVQENPIVIPVDIPPVMMDALMEQLNKCSENNICLKTETLNLINGNSAIEGSFEKNNSVDLQEFSDYFLIQSKDTDGNVVETIILRLFSHGTEEDSNTYGNVIVVPSYANITMDYSNTTDGLKIKLTTDKENSTNLENAALELLSYFNVTQNISIVEDKSNDNIYVELNITNSGINSYKFITTT